jgi:anti-sigma regulatory factor (Ser/Thr protein kinase)
MEIIGTRNEGPQAARVERREAGWTPAGDEAAAGVEADWGLAAQSAARSKRLALAPDSAHRARLFVAAALMDWGLWHLAERAVACTSELASNAIAHRPPQGPDEFEVVVALVGDTVVVEVRDGCRQLPVPRQRTAGLAESGRGLQIVEALCDQLRWRHTPGGKSVWFTLTTRENGALPVAA